MSDSVRPHRQQPTRLPHPWDSPGKNTGVGCHFLLQCMKVKSESEVAQSCPTSWPRGLQPTRLLHLWIFQARILEWGAIAFSDLNWNCIKIIHNDKPRQCIKKQRCDFTDKRPCSQSYGFSNSHVQMWEVDHKEGWEPKNWCFQIVVLEKAVESPLDSKMK